MAKPKILIYDIETFPNIGYTWGKWQQNVLKFHKEWELASVAYKWLGQEKVSCLARPQFKDKSDESLTEAFWHVMNEADITIAHNGDEFDNKKMRAKFIEYGLKPPTPAKSIDTKKIAKGQFYFNSNSLNDLGNLLKLGQKIRTGGMDLWFDCMEGDKEAWARMIAYNKQDVLLLEKVYLKLRAWAPNHPNLAIIEDNDKPACPSCAAESVQRRGWQILKLQKKPRFQCQECGHWFYGAMKKGAA